MDKTGKLTKEELEAIKEYADCIPGSILSKLLSHTTAVEGEVSTRDEQLAHYRGGISKQVREIDRLQALLKGRDGEIERLKKGWEHERLKEWATASRKSDLAIECHNLTSRNKDLQATLDRIREAAKKLHTHPMLDRDVPPGGHDFHGHVVVDKGEYRTLQQACTEGSEYGDSIGVNEAGEKQYRSKKVCPDCRGTKVNVVWTDTAQGYTRPCPTCKDGTGEVER